MLQYLSLDIVDRILRQRCDCVYVSYMNGYTSYSNVVYSVINRMQILCRDSKYIDGLGYIFNEKFDHLNNKDRIKDISKVMKNSFSPQYLGIITDTTVSL